MPRSLFPLLLCAMLCLTAHAEEEEEPAKPNPHMSKGFRAHMALMSGVSNVTSGGNSQTNGVATLTFDFKEKRYFGLELDAYGTLALKKLAVSTQTFGGLGALKIQVPIPWDTKAFVPKLGGGYAYQQVENKTDTGPSSGTVVVKGPYAVIGFDAEAIENVIVSFDYTKGIDQKGTLRTAVAGSPTTNSDLSGLSMSRLRIGAQYRFRRDLLAGIQFTKRTLAFRGAGGDTETSESQIQAVIAVAL